MKDAHAHDFSKKKSKTILVNAGKGTAKDTIKYFVCKCGAEQAYDLERKVS